VPRRLALTLALVASIFLSSACSATEVCNKRGGGTERCWVIYT
jgi:hypothetical protein